MGKTKTKARKTNTTTTTTTTTTTRTTTTKGKAKKLKPETIDQYLARLEPDKRAALQRLREVIRAAVPRAEECISYQVPAFRLDGKVLIWFAAATRHCSLFPGAVVSQFAHELRGFDTRKGTVHFTPDKPLPASLVRKLLKARMAKLAAS